LSSGSEATSCHFCTSAQPGNSTNTAEVIASDQPDPDSSPGNEVMDEDDRDSISVQVANVLNVEAQIKDLIQGNKRVQQDGLSRQECP